MKQILQNNLQQDWACSLIKCHTAAFTLNFNPPFIKAWAVSTSTGNFYPIATKWKSRPSPNGTQGDTDHLWFGLPEPLGFLEQTTLCHVSIHPFWATWELVLWQEHLWFWFVRGQHKGRDSAGRKASRQEAPRIHIALAPPPNASYNIQRWLDTLHWNITIILTTEHTEVIATLQTELR